MNALARFRAELQEIDAQGLYKRERIISSAQSAVIKLADGREVLNFCANNYLGLADHPEVIEAAKQAMDSHGFGLASVRFICGTQDLHKQLEAAISRFFGTDDTILYAACFDANGGLFEPLLNDQDAIISDALNHASIIDGVRLTKCKRLRYANANMDELRGCLEQAADCRTRMVTTDGVFSMDGVIAPLDRIAALTQEHDALLHIDECHATGFIGASGRGTAEHHGVMDKVDVCTSTLGKALGGGLGGFSSGRQEIIDLLRQRSRPYLFSNTLPPAVIGASLKVLELLEDADHLRAKLSRNTEHFRQRMTEAGFELSGGGHPISPVMLYDAPLAQQFAAGLLEEGVYAIGFFFPVVPKGQARIRVQLSAAHQPEHIDRAVDAFIKVGKTLQVPGVG